MKNETKVTTAARVVDLSATLQKIGYKEVTCPAMASKLVKKAYKEIGDHKRADEGGRYLPEDLFNSLCKTMESSKSIYSWKGSEAKAVFTTAENMITKADSRATLLRRELDAFYKAIPKSMPVEALTLALSGLLGEIEDEYPAPEPVVETPAE